MIQKQATWASICAGYVVFLGFVAQLIWSFNTHFEPVRWYLVPQLAILLFCVGWLSFEAGWDSSQESQQRREGS